MLALGILAIMRFPGLIARLAGALSWLFRIVFRNLPELLGIAVFVTALVWFVNNDPAGSTKDQFHLALPVFAIIGAIMGRKFFNQYFRRDGK